MNKFDSQTMADDPFHWSIDQVVQFLCTNSLTSWRQSSTPLPQPDPVLLEQTLRENDVTGEILLTEVDKNTLVQDFGLRSLGQRATVFKAIQHLRGLSQSYKEQATQLQPFHLNSPNPGPSFLDSPRTETSTAGIFQVRSQTPLLPQSPGLAFTTPVAEPPPSANPVAPAAAPPAPPPAAPPAGLPAAPPIASPSIPHSSAYPHLRSNEHYVVGGDGKKRRKLSLASTNDVAPKVSNQYDQKGYLGPKIDITDVFYEDVSDDESFLVFGSGPPTGKQLFVKQRMHHYFQQQPQAVEDGNGEDAIAIIPYGSNLLPRDSPQYFTLFRSHNGRFSATKENMSDWPQLHGEHHSVDYLLKKYPPQEERNEVLLPVYGESMSEGDYDSDTLREMEEERQEELSVKSKFLSAAELDSIIDASISAFREKWHNDKLPIQLSKARNLWIRSHKSKHGQINKATSQITYLEKRLRAIRKAIKDTPWSISKPGDVTRQCRSMEQTVFDCEKHKWEISVLELEECPTKLSRPSRPPPRPRVLIDEEELLSSDHESEEEEEDDGFIVPDTEPGPRERPSPRPIVSSTLPMGHSESEDDIVPASRHKSRSANRPSSTTPVPVGLSDPLNLPPKSSRAQRPQSLEDIEVVDLTKSSDEAEPNFDVQTPPLNPVENEDRKFQTTPKLVLGESAIQARPPARTPTRTNLPDVMDFAALAGIDWELVEERLDKKRLLSKLVDILPKEASENLLELITSNEANQLRKIVWRNLELLLSRGNKWKGVKGYERQIHMRVAVLFTSWVNCRKLDRKGIPKEFIETAIKDKKSFASFHKHLSAALHEFHSSAALREFQRKPHSPPKGEKVPSSKSSRNSHSDSSGLPKEDPDEEILDDEEDPLTDHDDAINHTPHKKRKRHVKQSQEAMDTQKLAQRRVEDQRNLQKKLAGRLERMGVGNDDPEHQVVSFDEPVICLDPHIGGRVKPHQLSGIQFMWREIINDEKRQGCLLAHTMGLGKTMQIISLLVTIANAAASPDSRISKQVPNALRFSRSLILCPSSLIENWWEEFHLWSPQDNLTRRNLGEVRKVSPSLPVKERLQEISQWHIKGGVLLMSYDLFRQLVLNKATKNRPAPFSEEMHNKLQKQLLQGPNIIVADEAHKMKNSGTGIAEAASKFRSKSRIALTGSPLANNLTDYYAMINWIAPGYLGDLVQFKVKYVEPIEQGLYADSTNWERRKSLKRLQVLKKDIDPKVNRADITVLEHDLPSKTEFVITVPLTTIQEEAYKLSVDYLLSDKETSNPRLWEYCALLSLLCNHPASYVEKLRDRKNKVQSVPELDSELEKGPGDSPAASLLPSTGLASLEKFFESVEPEKLKSLELSHRAHIADKIIQLSIDAGDKVLVFSQSIPTLNFLESILKRRNRKYCRLDGKTPIASRQASTKSFNQADSNMQIYLISTRAGGLGLNIPGANRVIIFDFSFNPTWEEQAVGRSYRLGQQKPVFVYRFIAGGTFEDVMYNKTVFKTQLSFRVVDKKNPIRWASKSPGDYLFHPKPVPQKELFEYKGKDPAVLDKILAVESNIREIALTETFQREDNDKLTPEEEKDVQDELADERLKRNDPEAWAKKQKERELRELATLSRPNPPPYTTSQSPFLTASTASMFSNSFSANRGRPPVMPDRSLFAPATGPPGIVHQTGPNTPQHGPVRQPGSVPQTGPARQPGPNTLQTGPIPAPIPQTGPVPQSGSIPQTDGPAPPLDTFPGLTLFSERAGFPDTRTEKGPITAAAAGEPRMTITQQKEGNPGPIASKITTRQPEKGKTASSCKTQ
ncbi:hypothetical protein AJ80_02496 [Polytolypa hystricis UAMH7299]|uniref:SNF2 family helicase/ATPase n=1 Tax=Polytolypa hystricis (strain UAMH7299) TaxID=1447883 RepID=A0A2B7YP11_POLH7|nr:hypothetical protein AJ80_02496 [Polytolypa hystricis UAMH7299]